MAVFDHLAEDTEVITDAVTKSGYLQSGQRVDKAGRQTAQAAITQAHIRFHVFDIIEVETNLIHGLAHGIFNAQVDDVVAHHPAHQKLQ